MSLEIMKVISRVASGTSLPDAALVYGAAGWPIIPTYDQGPRAKQPRTMRGHHDATDNLETIGRWWKMWPTSSIGCAIPPGMIVLDIDVPEALADLEAIYGGPLPDTLTVRSGRAGGGWHLYFTTERTDLTQGVVRHSDGRPVRGVDVRVGGRGYLILPPSLHAISGKPYRWENVTAPLPMPTALEAACAPVAPRPMPLGSHVPVSQERALAGLLRTVDSAPKGTRNRALFWAACRMAERERKGLATDWTGLSKSAAGAGLTGSEIQATIASAVATGAREVVKV